MRKEEAMSRLEPSQVPSEMMLWGMLITLVLGLVIGFFMRGCV